MRRRDLIKGVAGSMIAWPLGAGAQQRVYRIGPLDMLEISVFKVPDLSKTVQVGDDGNISYPLIGEVPAAGRTAHELESDLAKRLGDKYLRLPRVTVFVREYHSQH